MLSMFPQQYLQQQTQQIHRNNNNTNGCITINNINHLQNLLRQLNNSKIPVHKVVNNGNL